MQSYTYLALANTIATGVDGLSLSTGYLEWKRQGQYKDVKVPERTSDSESLLLTTAEKICKKQVEAPKEEEEDTKAKSAQKGEQQEKL